MRESICYLNGVLGPLSEAKVSVLDRGFIFGDGVYELVPVFDGMAFRLPEHLGRLRRSLAAVLMDNPLSDTRWTSIVEELVQANRGGDQNIYIQVTRGVAPRVHVLPDKIEPTVFVMSSPALGSSEAVPIAAILVQDIRWRRCDIKSTSLIANVVSRETAAQAGSQEALFVRDGYVTEGAASNVFVATDGTIKTPPLSPEILPGVTRDLIVELLGSTDEPAREEPISEQELRRSDEVWVTSSRSELVPVIRIDDKPIGAGSVGPVFRRVQRIYRAYKTKFLSVST
jgi:D-alanine transaminase